MKQPNSPARQHYYSMAVEITIVEQAGEGQVAVSTVKQNVLLHKSEGSVTLKDIRRVQEQAQLNFFAKIADPSNMTVQDVVILNVSHLGFMTQEEWLDGVELPKAEPKAGLQLVRTEDVMPAPDQVQ